MPTFTLLQNFANIIAGNGEGKFAKNNQAGSVKINRFGARPADSDVQSFCGIGRPVMHRSSSFRGVEGISSLGIQVQ